LCKKNGLIQRQGPGNVGGILVGLDYGCRIAYGLIVLGPIPELQLVGCEVPVGFEDSRSSSHVEPPLTTVAHPVDGVVGSAIDV